MPQLPAQVASLVAALHAEIDAQLRSDAAAVEKARLVGGRPLSAAGAEREYEFTVARWPEQLSVERGLLVRAAHSGGPWLPVIRHERRDKRVILRCEGDLGADDVVAHLREDPTSSDRLLAAELAKYGTDQPPGDLARANLVLGLGRARTGHLSDPERFLSPTTRPLNRAQRAAVAQALDSDLTFVWGPPGTGKTDVVVKIVEGCVRQGLRVLLTAPTNIAVDQALERVCETLESLPGFDRGLVRRVGDIHLPTLRQRYESFIDPGQTLRRCAADIDARTAWLRAEHDSVRTALEARSRADALAVELAEAERAHARRHELTMAGQARLAAIAAQESRLREQVAAAAALGGLRARLVASKLDLWRRRLDEVVAERQQVEAACAAPDWIVQRERMAIQQLRERLAEAASAAGPESAETLRARLRAMGTSLSALQAERAALERELESGCRVAAMTTSAAYHRAIPLTAVEAVVIDEAGMVSLPTAFFLAGKAARRLVLAGDFRQLPAVVTGHADRTASPAARELVRDWMARDAFHAAGVAGPAGVTRDDPRLAQLDTQYRMRPAICGLVNAIAYPDAPLRTGRDDVSAVPASPLLEAPLVLVDSSERHVSATTRQRNPVHAATIREIVRLLQHDKVLPARRDGTTSPTDTLAVIAPYNAQKKLLKGELKERFGAEYEGLADTVHRFQGSQRPIVVLDTVVAGGRGLGPFFSGQGVDSDTTRLLNVAVSRAQDHLVVVANVRHMRGQLAPGSEVGVLLDHLEEHAHRLPIDELIPVRTAAELGELTEDDLARPAFFPADESDRAIRWDLDRARVRVEIYCAFMRASRVRMFQPALRACLARGVRVTVFTRGGAETPENAPLIDELRADGCDVVARDQMHEKVVVVDDVLWHGSLNLFAHTRSTELMMRVASRTACEGARATVERSRPTRARPAPPWLSKPSAPAVVGDRVYLNVPYAEKDAAKALGARWDPDRRQWWVAGGGSLPTGVERWLL